MRRPRCTVQAGRRGLMTQMTLIRQLRTSSMRPCAVLQPQLSRMLPACTGNGRRQCCGIHPSEQPSPGASSQPRLRKAIMEREAGQIMHMAPSVSLVVAVATLAAAAPTATVQLLRAATTVCKLNAGSTGDTGFKVGAALIRQRRLGNCLAVAIAGNCLAVAIAETALSASHGETHAPFHTPVSCRRRCRRRTRCVAMPHRP